MWRRRRGSDWAHERLLRWQRIQGFAGQLLALDHSGTDEQQANARNALLGLRDEALLAGDRMGAEWIDQILGDGRAPSDARADQ
jgi:hypothetical protein